MKKIPYLYAGVLTGSLVTQVRAQGIESLGGSYEGRGRRGVPCQVNLQLEADNTWTLKLTQEPVVHQLTDVGNEIDDASVHNERTVHLDRRGGDAFVWHRTQAKMKMNREGELTSVVSQAEGQAFVFFNGDGRTTIECTDLRRSDR